MKKIIISEQQTNRLVRHLLNESDDEEKNLTVNLGMYWGMGKWKLTETHLSDILSKMQQVLSFIRKNKGNKIQIQVEAGESQVPNMDTESNPPIRAKVGDLSRRRGNVVAEKLRNFFASQVGKTISEEEMPLIPDPKIVIGSTPYRKGETNLRNPDVISQFQKEQYVKATITVIQDINCLVGLNVGIGYLRGRNGAKHACDESIFQLKMNGVPIGVINLNNGKVDMSCIEYDENNLPIMFKIRARGLKMEPEEYAKKVMSIYNATTKGRQVEKVEGGSRFYNFTINQDFASRILSVGANNIKLSIVPMVGPNTEYSILHREGTHSDTPYVKITDTKTGTVYYDDEPNAKLNRGAMTETVIMVMDKCGRPITSTR